MNATAYPAGTIVIDDPEYDHATGVVIEPTELQLAEGREYLSTDLAACVLVSWKEAPGFRTATVRWEYTEDLFHAS